MPKPPSSSPSTSSSSSPVPTTRAVDGIEPILRVQQHWRPLMVNVHHESGDIINWAKFYFLQRPVYIGSLLSVTLHFILLFFWLISTEFVVERFCLTGKSRSKSCSCCCRFGYYYCCCHICCCSCS